MITLHALTLLAALSAPGQSVLLDFYADWCGPCRAMEPTVRRLVADGYPVRMVNIDQDSSLARQYRVDGVPTYVLVADGREVSRAVGPTSYAHLAGMFSAAKPAAAAAPPVASPPAAVRQGSAPPSRAEEADPQTRALRATVRLCIEDAGGRSFGTGTIIDTHQQEALVMTCGHLFRESQGQGKMSVDVFPAGVQNPVAGEVLTLLSYDLEQDVALLAIRLNCPATPVPVAAAGYQVRPGDRVFSVGCDQGAPPTVRPSQVTALNKYQGPPNIESAGQPVIGRSGGGLFSADGQLIGVCNLADPQDDEGIYAALSLLHSHLDKIGQSRIYQRNAASSAVAQVPAAMAPTAPATLAVSPPDMASQMPHPPLGAPDPSVAAAAAAPLIATAAAALDDDTEVICIVRSKRDPRGPSQVLYFDRLSPALLEQLTRAARPAQTGGPVMLEASRDSLPPSRATSEASSPVVRAQAY
ncbi:MAG: thioredoxin fold domain-containing protein [Candidatus Anammoximicrobium sp.]|nr:thioredoxin fold domain-containing protein [Candidatus Anammoximicrobium sp.]